MAEPVGRSPDEAKKQWDALSAKRKQVEAAAADMRAKRVAEGNADDPDSTMRADSESDDIPF
jgi:hypothetical protein